MGSQLDRILNRRVSAHPQALLIFGSSGSNSVALITIIIIIIIIIIILIIIIIMMIIIIKLFMWRFIQKF